MTTAFEILKRLCDRHHGHGLCISCGKGPRESTTPWGQCRGCARTVEGDQLRVAYFGGDDTKEIVKFLRDGSRHGTNTWSEADEIATAIEKGKFRKPTP